MNELIKKPVFWIVGLALAAALIFLGLKLSGPSGPAKKAEEPPPRVEAAPPTPPKDENAIKNPLPESPLKLADKAEAERDRANKLPQPDDSDSIVSELAASLIGSSALNTFFQNSNFVRRLVASVDNLPREKVASRLNPLKPIAGKFGTIGEDSSLAVSPGNYSRYTPFVDFFSGVDSRKIVDAYIRFYPLFQQEYKALGYPNKYFNDRVVEAIDDLLAAPDLADPPKLVQPKVQFQFADRELESLSHGKKAMIRMGPANATRVKAKLRELRSTLTAAAANRPKM